MISTLFTIALSLLVAIPANAAPSPSQASMADPQNQSVSSNTITGVVRTTSGEPIAGAMVIVRIGEKVYGESTGLDGRFTLSLPSDPSEQNIIFSLMGYEEITMKIGSRRDFEVEMKDDSQMLAETVVVGYGVQKKVNLTGSVTSVKFDDKVNSRPLTNVSTALSGMSAGMAVTQSSGKPGSSATISIRGTGTLNDASPLVLVDGVEWDMDNVNPADIESISILKDASSTAIYGALGANGVILITTKSGSGEPKFSYNGYLSIQNANNKLALVSDYAEHMELANEYAFQCNIPNIYSQVSIDRWRYAKQHPDELNDYGMPNRIAYPNTDWFDTIFKTGFSQNHHLSMAGSTEKMKYSMAIGLLDNRGVMNINSAMNSGEKKITFQSKVEGTVGKWLTLGANVQGRRSDLGLGDVASAFSWVNSTVPGIWPGGEDSKFGVPGCTEESSDANNLIFAASQVSGENIVVDSNISGYFKAVLGKFSLEGNANYQFFNSNTRRWPNYYRKYNFTEDYQLSEASLAAATIYNASSRSEKINMDLLLRYTSTFGDAHNFSAMAGYNAQQYKSSYFSATRKGLTSWELHELSSASDLLYAPGGSAAWAMESFFARTNYNYDERYLLEANLRLDGSSRFSAKSRWGLFPSASAGWRINKEEWMADASSWLSNLKLRASYGQVGNCRTGDYAWQSVYGAKKVVANNSNVYGLVQTKVGNEDLQWESTTAANIGLDAGFWKDRLTVEADIYNKDTEGILYTPSLYYTMGVKEGPTENLASLNNKGLELTAKWSDTLDGGLFYSIGGNFSYNISKVTKYKGKLNLGWNADHNLYSNNYAQVSQGGYGGYILEDHMLGETYLLSLYHGSGNSFNPDGSVNIHGGPKDGMIRTESDMEWVKAMLAAGYKFRNESKAGIENIWYGDLIYEDIDEDGNYGSTNDYLFTGHSSIPKYNFALNISLAWKGFDFYALFAGQAGFYLNYVVNSAPNKGRAIYQYLADDHFFYDPDDPMDSRTNIKATYPRLGGYSSQSSDFWEYKGDYIKLKNIQLGYTIPSRVSQRMGIDKCRCYFSADNLFTLTEFPGMDPELGTSITYPIMKQCAFGVQLSF